MRLLFIGFGTVAQGLCELLLERRDLLASRYGFDWRVVGIADTVKGSAVDTGGLDLQQMLGAAAAGRSLSDLETGSSWNGLQMIERTGADVLIEVTPTDLDTAQPATDHIRAALERGLHVATTNKGPLALHARELADLARRNDVSFLYEGTVMAGTPLLNLIRETLAGAGITEIRGILNGTTNFILTEMETGRDYEAALAMAQQLGYAEAVPDADVLGWDALAKVTILANVVFEAPLLPDQIPCTGITGITTRQIATARAAGSRYKLVGRVWRDGCEVRGAVAPELVEMSHPLAGVSGATNAATIATEALGEVTVVGPGAGRRETGYALLNDLITIAGRTRP
jgi:homoserine dehydrogenase